MKQKHATVYVVTLMDYLKTSASENNRGKMGLKGNGKGTRRMGKKLEKERPEEIHEPASLSKEEYLLSQHRLKKAVSPEV